MRSWSSSTRTWRCSACTARRRSPSCKQRLQRTEDLLVVVDDALPAQRVAVGLVGRRQSADVVEGVLHLLRTPKPEPDEREPVDVGRDGVGVHPSLPGRHEALDDRAHPALVEQLRSPAQRAAEDAVAPGVERLDARTEAGQPRRHLLLGLLVVGERDARFALVAAIGQQVAVALREHAGLAGTGRRDDPGRTGPVGDRLELVGGQHGASARTGAGCGVSRPISTVSRWTITAPSSGTASGARGPPSTHAGVPSGSTTSAVASLRGSEPRRLAGPPPDRVAVAACVVAVGPHEEVEPFGPGLRRRAQLPGRGEQSGRCAERARVDRELDHHRRAAGPRLVQAPDHAGRRLQRTLVDDDACRRRPTPVAAPLRGPTITARPRTDGTGRGHRRQGTQRPVTTSNC